MSTEEKEKEDNENNINEEDITFAILNEIQNSVSKSLKFMVEKPREFKENWLPTLDFSIKEHKTLKYMHRYYEKEMNTPWVVLSNGWNGKRSDSIEWTGQETVEHGSKNLYEHNKRNNR